MNARIRRKLEMANRVFDFTRAHPVKAPGFAAVVERLTEQLGLARARGLEQEQGRIASRAATRHVATLRDQIHRRLQYLATVSRATPSLSQVLVVAPNRRLPLADYLVVARNSVSHAREREDEFVANGLSPTLLDEVDKLVDEIKETTSAFNKANMRRIGGVAGLKELAAKLSDTVRILDGIYRYHFGDDSDLMAEWDMVRALAPVPRSRPKEDAA